MRGSPNNISRRVVRLMRQPATKPCDPPDPLPPRQPHPASRLSALGGLASYIRPTVFRRMDQSPVATNAPRQRSRIVIGPSAMRSSSKIPLVEFSPVQRERGDGAAFARQNRPFAPMFRERGLLPEYRLRFQLSAREGGALHAIGPRAF